MVVFVQCECACRDKSLVSGSGESACTLLDRKYHCMRAFSAAAPVTAWERYRYLDVNKRALTDVNDCGERQLVTDLLLFLACV
jgi:hypothetical protein